MMLNHHLPLIAIPDTGHYKATTTDEHLSATHSRIMSIPYMVSFSPSHWRKAIDIMLEETAGDPKVHQLWIIALRYPKASKKQILTQIKI